MYYSWVGTPNGNWKNKNIPHKRKQENVINYETLEETDSKVQAHDKSYVMSM